MLNKLKERLIVFEIKFGEIKTFSIATWFLTI